MTRVDERTFARHEWIARHLDAGHSVTKHDRYDECSCGSRYWRESAAAESQPAPATAEVTITREVNKLVDGYDAQFWHDSYNLLRDAVCKHLDDCIQDDDVAEEAILIAAIETAGKRLQPAPVPVTPENGMLIQPSPLDAELRELQRLRYREARLSALIERWKDDADRHMLSGKNGDLMAHVYKICAKELATLVTDEDAT